MNGIYKIEEDSPNPSLSKAQLPKEQVLELPDFQPIIQHYQNGMLEQVQSILSEEILPFFQNHHHISTNAVLETGIFQMLLNILQTIPINFSDPTSITKYAFMTICCIIASDEIQSYLDILFNEGTEFHQILYTIFDSYWKTGNVDLTYLAYATEVLTESCKTKYIFEFRKHGFFELLCHFLRTNLEDISNQATSNDWEINCEQSILACICAFIVNDRERITQDDIQLVLPLFFLILHEDISLEKHCKPYLLKIMCEFLEDEISDDPTKLICFNEAKIFEESVKLIHNSEIATTDDNLFTPIFDLLGEIVGMDVENLPFPNPEVQKHVQLIIRNIAKNIDVPSIFAYITEDFDSLHDPKYDELYVNIFILLNNVINELEEVPEEFQNDEIELQSAFEVIHHILQECRHTLTVESLRFFLALFNFSPLESQSHILSFLNPETFESFWYAVTGCDSDLLEAFLNLIESILSKWGRLGFENEEYTELLNNVIPCYLNELVPDDEKMMARLQGLLKDYYPDFDVS